MNSKDNVNDAPYQPPFKIGDDVYVITCGMKKQARIADMPYKTHSISNNKWLVKVFLRDSRSYIVYDIANIVHMERSIDKLASWDVMYNILGFDIRN